ncbi:MAG: branched-chain amino acid transporter AzlD [Lachnospiraceae bacterium]|nr:branched-chain amino acid transporter AzlD [Lachnospiraceae bacterium]
MTLTQQLITIGIVIAVTIFTRAIAFWLFPEGKKTPPFITYLGKVLPPAVFGMLVIYCLKDSSLFSQTHALPELLSIALIAVVHVWKRNMFLSIATGTVCYMLLMQFVF